MSQARVGVVIVTHYGLGDEFLQAMRLIVPDAPPFEAVAVQPDQSADVMRENIQRALRSQDGGRGVLVLTDMFGGTPANMSLSFLDEHHVEVITGVNLPMLIKLATLPDEKPLEELAPFIKEYGQRNISLASELFQKRGTAAGKPGG